MIDTMLPLKKPPPGATNRTFGVNQPIVGSRDAEPNARVSLEVFGGGSQTSSLLFSRTRSAWKDALRSAEAQLESSNNDSEEFQPNFGSRDVGPARASLEVFSGGSKTSPLEFSPISSVRDDAPQRAESRLQSTSNGSQEQETVRGAAAISDTLPPSSQQQVTISRMDYPSDKSAAAPSPRIGFEDDVSEWLASAEAETSGVPVKAPSTPSVSRSFGYGSDGCESHDLNHDACTPRSSECSAPPPKTTAEQDWDEVLRHKADKNLAGLPKVSDDALSERAARWGYGVVLKPSGGHRGSGSAESERISRLSWTTGRSDTSSAGGKSSRTTSEGSSASSGFSSLIPGISKDVKEALGSFQLAFVVCDALNHEYPVLYASAGFFSMTGYSAKEVVGRNCRLLQGEYTDANDIARIREALKEGKIYTGKILNYKKDGTPFWNMLTISPIKDDDGRLIKYIGMLAEVKEGGVSGKDFDQVSLPPSVKKFLEGDRQNGTNYKSADGVIVPAPPAPSKTSFDKDNAQKPRYSLSSSRPSSEISSNTLSVQDSQQRLKAEVAALRAGTIGSNGTNGISTEVVRSTEDPKVRRGESGRKSSKRASLMKMFKTLSGKISLPKRGSRDRSEDDQFVMDDNFDVFSDRDDDDEYEERKQSRSSVYTRRSTGVVSSELDQSCDTPKARRNSSLASRPEERQERTSTSSYPESSPGNGQSLVRKERVGGSGSTPESEPRRPAMGYGRRSAQYPMPEGQAGGDGEGVPSEGRDRRHSLPPLALRGPSVNIGGQSQFCIVHP